MQEVTGAGGRAFVHRVMTVAVMQVFSTAADMQTQVGFPGPQLRTFSNFCARAQVGVRVLQGEREMAADNKVGTLAGRACVSTQSARRSCLVTSI